MNNIRILGIDPGIAIVGAGVVDKIQNTYRPVWYGAITTPAHTPLELRLMDIYGRAVETIEKYKPDAVSVEELFFNNNAKTAFAWRRRRTISL